jgi:hypothetical protein
MDDTVRVDSGTPHSSNYRIVPINTLLLSYCILYNTTLYLILSSDSVFQNEARQVGLHSTGGVSFEMDGVPKEEIGWEMEK